MSVQSEITRISGNVAAALAAIAEKGVSVPSGSKSDALASLIASIEAGGGGEDNGVYYEIVTFSEQAYYYEMTHTLGDYPRFVLYAALSFGDSVTYDHRNYFAGYTGTKRFTSSAYMSHQGQLAYLREYYNSTRERFKTSTSLATTNPDVCCPNENTIRFGSSNYYKFDSGDTFIFMVMR